MTRKAHAVSGHERFSSRFRAPGHTHTYAYVDANDQWKAPRSLLRVSTYSRHAPFTHVRRQLGA